MRPHLLTALLLCALPAQAQTQAQLEAGRSVDLVFSARDLVFTATDLKFAVVDMGGKTQDLQVKETATEIRIELAADVLFDFDKSTIKPGGYRPPQRRRDHQGQGQRPHRAHRGTQ